MFDKELGLCWTGFMKSSALGLRQVCVWVIFVVELGQSLVYDRVRLK
jgi:hypothetical protein